MSSYERVIQNSEQLGLQQPSVVQPQGVHWSVLSMIQDLNKPKCQKPSDPITELVDYQQCLPKKCELHGCFMFSPFGHDLNMVAFP